MHILGFVHSAAEAAFSFGADTGFRVLAPLCGSDRNATSTVPWE